MVRFGALKFKRHSRFYLLALVYCSPHTFYACLKNALSIWNQLMKIKIRPIKMDYEFNEPWGSINPSALLSLLEYPTIL